MANVAKFGYSEKEQGKFFQEACESWRTKGATVKQGKGSRWRTLPTDKYKDNYKDIFKHD